MARNKTELAREAWRCLFDFIIDTASHRNRVLGAHALSPNDSRALFALDAKNPRTMGSLADEWGTDASYATSVVDRLEKRGLAMRSAQTGDRRVKLVTLTREGAKLKQHLARALYEPPPELLAMNTADLEALHASVSKLHATRPSAEQRTRAGHSASRRQRSSSETSSP
ncbi:MAG: MarR family transcriptional regulator [Kofleriaceae bacterium]|nr:MarR family transcriptional regulator [Kofleriaceae bacterium]